MVRWINCSIICSHLLSVLTSLALLNPASSFFMLLLAVQVFGESFGGPSLMTAGVTVRRDPFQIGSEVHHPTHPYFSHFLFTLGSQSLVLLLLLPLSSLGSWWVSHDVFRGVVCCPDRSWRGMLPRLLFSLSLFLSPSGPLSVALSELVHDRVAAGLDTRAADRPGGAAGGLLDVLDPILLLDLDIDALLDAT